MKDGVIADFEVTEKMLTYFIKKAHNRNVWVRPRIVIGVPSEITQVEKRAVKDSAYRAKASEVHLVEEAMAAAIGAGMPITEPSGNMIVDIGGGTTDIAVISLAGIVYSKAVRVAGNEMDEAIIQYIKKTYNLLIGERTAEPIKIEIGSAFPLEERMTMEIKGRHLIEGVPKTITDQRRRNPRGAGRNGQRHRRRRARGARAHAAGAVGRHRRSRHRADRRRVDAEEPRQAAARGNRAAAGDGRGSAVVGRARRRQDAVGLQPAQEDLDRLRLVAILDIRQTLGYLFLAVMLGHVILISAQVNSRSGVPVLESVTFGVFAEAQRGSSAGVVERSARPGTGTSASASVEAENAEPRAASSTTCRSQLPGATRAGRSRARGSQQLLDAARSVEPADDGRRHHRVERVARFPDVDDRQGHQPRPAAADMAVIARRRRRRPRRRAERTGGRRCSLLDRPQRGRRRAHRAVARAGRRHGGGE